MVPDREGPSGSEGVRIFVSELIGNITTLDIKGFSEIAEFVGDKVDKGKIKIVESNLAMPSATDFVLSEDIRYKSECTPTIIVDERKILLGNTRNMSDLIRTLAIAAQYPDNGYEKRLAYVYWKGLKVQEDWLNKVAVDMVPLDPRREDCEALIKEILGDERYYLDVGFGDWENVADILRSGQSNGIGFELDKLVRSPMVFIKRRNELEGMPSQRIMGLSADERAKETAYKMVTSSLRSGSKLN